MARKDWYTVFERDDHYLVQKVDPDDHTPLSTVQDGTNTLPAYKVSKTNDKLSMCDCWAGSKWCRHKVMIVEFQKLDRIDQRWLYSYDKKQWLPPLSESLE